MERDLPLSRRRFLLWSLAASAGTTALLAGCGNQSTSSQTTGGQNTAKGSSMPGVLRYPLREEPTSMDPHLCISAGTWDLLQNTYETLYQYDENSKLVPILAAELPTISSDGKTYTVPLRKDIKFHDGTPLTAELVKANALRIMSKELASLRATLTLDDLAGAQAYMDGKSKELSGVQVVDAQTIRFVLAEPRAYFVDKLAAFYLTTPDAIAKAPKNEQGLPEIDKTCAIGTGPFLLKDYIRQSKVTQTANDAYWGGKPKLTRIERPILIDGKTARNLYEADQVDILLETVADFEADQKDAQRKAEIKIFPQCGVYYITLGQKKMTAFHDKRVRQALSLAIDRAAVANDAMVGMLAAANGFLVPGMMGSNKPEDQPETLRHNPEAAKKLLAEAGYTKDKPLAFTLLYSEGSVSAAKVTQVLKEQWGAVGVDVTLQEAEWGSLLKRMDDHDFDAIYSGWLAGPDPHQILYNILDSASPNNHSGGVNPVFDKLSRAADSERDVKKRTSLCAQAQAAALDDATILPIVFPRDIRLFKSYVSGYRFGPTGMLSHTKTEVA